jgi:hypothetical protein
MESCLLPDSWAQWNAKQLPYDSDLLTVPAVTPNKKLTPGGEIHTWMQFLNWYVLLQFSS